MTPIKPEHNSTIASFDGIGGSSGYSSGPSISSSDIKIKRKPVHVAKPLSATQIRQSLKISKKDIMIARRIVNKIRHK
jgi:DNA-directed RNA polymerase specialized sigma54-like protein